MRISDWSSDVCSSDLPGAVAAVAALRRRGYALGIISGDTPDAVMPVAAALGIDAAQSGLLPTEKTARLASLATAGRKALMVGDGLNDAPALVAAHVSIAPGGAAGGGQIGRAPRGGRGGK